MNSNFLSHQNLEKAVHHIMQNMWDDGMIKTYSSYGDENVPEHDDLITFTTGLVGLIFSEITLGNKLLDSLVDKMYRFITSELIGQKFWMWSSLQSSLRKVIPIDIDTCSLNSEFLLSRGIKIENHKTLALNANPQTSKGFYTWLILRRSNLKMSISDLKLVFRHGFYQRWFFKNTSAFASECNDITSVNLFHYLMLNDISYLNKAEEFLEQFSSVNSMVDQYYLDEYYKAFFVSRVLRHSKNHELRNRFTPKPESVKQTRDLDLASLILTYKYYELKVPKAWLNELAGRQQKNGGWQEMDTFTYGGKAVWRSPGLNTAFAVAALMN